MILTREPAFQGEGKIPEPPPEEVAQGVLPRLIATLVSRRRQVKSLMKDKTAPKQKLLQVSSSAHLRWLYYLMSFLGRVVGH